MDRSHRHAVTLTLTRCPIYELNLKILKVCLHTKNELFRSRLLKVKALKTDKHTNTQTDRERQTNATQALILADQM